MSSEVTERSQRLLTEEELEQRLYFVSIKELDLKIKEDELLKKMELLTEFETHLKEEKTRLEGLFKDVLKVQTDQKIEENRFIQSKTNWMEAQNRMKKDFEEYKERTETNLSRREKAVTVRENKTPALTPPSTKSPVFDTDAHFFKPSQLNLPETKTQEISR